MYFWWSERLATRFTSSPSIFNFCTGKDVLCMYNIYVYMYHHMHFCTIYSLYIAIFYILYSYISYMNHLKKVKEFQGQRSKRFAELRLGLAHTLKALKKRRLSSQSGQDSVLLLIDLPQVCAERFASQDTRGGGLLSAPPT